jgi:hypothetical protein
VQSSNFDEVFLSRAVGTLGASNAKGWITHQPQMGRERSTIAGFSLGNGFYAATSTRAPSPRRVATNFGKLVRMQSTSEMTEGPVAVSPKTTAVIAIR